MIVTNRFHLPGPDSCRVLDYDQEDYEGFWSLALGLPERERQRELTNLLL
jgi:hypothetical protein